MASLTRGLRVLTVLAGVAGALAALGWYTVQGQTGCEVCVVGEAVFFRGDLSAGRGPLGKSSQHARQRLPHEHLIALPLL